MNYCVLLCCVLCILLIMIIHNAALYHYGCGFGCGRNVCLCVNLMLPPCLSGATSDMILQI